MKKRKKKWIPFFSSFLFLSTILLIPDSAHTRPCNGGCGQENEKEDISLSDALHLSSIPDIEVESNPDSFLFNFRDAFGQQQPPGVKSLGGWDERTTRLRGHASGHYLSALAQAYAGIAPIAGIGARDSSAPIPRTSSSCWKKAPSTARYSWKPPSVMEIDASNTGLFSIPCRKSFLLFHLHVFRYRTCKIFTNPIQNSRAILLKNRNKIKDVFMTRIKKKRPESRFRTILRLTEYIFYQEVGMKTKFLYCIITLLSI